MATMPGAAKTTLWRAGERASERPKNVLNVPLNRIPGKCPFSLDSLWRGLLKPCPKAAGGYGEYEWHERPPAAWQLSASTLFLAASINAPHHQRDPVRGIASTLFFFAPFAWRVTQGQRRCDRLGGGAASSLLGGEPSGSRGQRHATLDPLSAQFRPISAPDAESDVSARAALRTGVDKPQTNLKPPNLSIAPSKKTLPQQRSIPQTRCLCAAEILYQQAPQRRTAGVIAAHSIASRRIASQ